MEKIYKRVKKYSFFFQIIFLSFLQLKSQVLTQTFSFSGTMQTFVVPSCVSTMTMEVLGAQGGVGTPTTVNYGGYAKGVFNVTVGDLLNIYVGSQPTSTAGGYNGGGTGDGLGFGGGGGSDIRLNGTALANRIIVAGGAGGGGIWNTTSEPIIGGAGGGLVGGDGYRTSVVNPGGSGGGQVILVNGFCGSANNAASSGGLGFGGNIAVGACGCNSGYGGGGGYYGGGAGGNCRGGGGGSGYIIPAATNTVFTSGINIGNGKVILSYITNGSGVIASASSLSICSGATPTLSASNVLSYTWTPGGSNATSITVSPTSNTSYTVQGTNSIGCISSSVLNLTVDPGVPTITVANTASASGGICPNSTVALTASGATTYTWIGGSSTVINGVVFSPIIASGYTVTGGNACGTTTAATSVSVHPFPTITPIASSASLCSGLNLTLTGVGNATAYAWSGGSIPITNGVGFAPSTTVTYTVIGTSALSCTASATIPVTVVTTPINFPTQNTGIVCIGGSSTLTATGATNYTWTSATQTVFTSSFVVTPNVGITTYTVTKSNANCFDVKTISVVTNSLPTIFAIVNPTLVCALKPATLAVGGGQSYTWTAPGSPNFTFTGSTPVVSPSVSTNYSVAASDGTCISVTTVSLAVNPNPTITTTASSASICSGQSVTLNANGGINYTWTATTGTFYTQSITDAPTIATAYNVSGDNIFGCTTGASTVVLVNPNPVIGASASKILVCSGGASTLSASGANTYTWDANANGALTSSTVVNPTSPTSAIMIYTVQGSNSFPCQSSQTVQVAVFVPTLTVTGNTNTCYGGAIQLGAGGGNINTYVWYTSIGGSPYGFQTLNTTVTAAAVYTVNAVTSTLSVVCPATQTVAVGVYYNPTITATPDRTLICTKESVDLYGGGGVSYSWSNGTPGGTITVSPTNNTTYTVTGTDANGCVGTGTVLVKVSGCAGINELSNVNNRLVLYPNPNNGEFTIQANTEITLTLVNELGQVIKTINLSGVNNYKASVADLAKGIYFITGQKDNVQINQKVIVAK